MATKERPIPFHAHEVRATLDGRQTQFRRVVKHRLPTGPCDIRDVGNGPEIYGAGGEWLSLKCPYGHPGGRLWVRETWLRGWTYAAEYPCVFYRADNACRLIDRDTTVRDPQPSAPPSNGKWRPSIHMPRWASRLTLEVTDVRVERVQDIGRDGRKAVDVLAEGIDPQAIAREREWFHADDSPAIAFSRVWESINASNGFGWDSNPYVWVVEFQRVEAE